MSLYERGKPVAVEKGRKGKDKMDSKRLVCEAEEEKKNTTRGEAREQADIPMSIELGYGAGAIADYPWHIDGKEWTAEDNRKAEECLRALPGLRINWIDTANRYGKGKSEDLVGRFSHSKTATITKITMEKPEVMDELFAESISRLGRKPDVLLLHNPDLSKPEEMAMGSRWLVRQECPWYGLSTEPVDEVARMSDLCGFNAIEFPASPWDWRAERTISSWLRNQSAMLKIANRILGGPTRERAPGDVERAIGYAVENREWIDVALIGTTNIGHLRQCVEIFNRIKKETVNDG